MNILHKIRSFGHKGKLAAVVVLALGVGVALPAVNAEFYPDRPTYNYNKFDPNNLNCNDPNNIATQNGRCGSMDGPVFNSFVNTPSYGDERAFFDGRRADAATNTNANVITNVNDGSKEVVLRMYVHNNANQNTNASGKGIAHNAKARILLPTDTQSVLRARAYISANNAALVEDTVDMTGSEKFNVSYVAGSAKLLRGNSQYALSDNIVTTGAPIGDKAMNGELPGCFDYAALIEVRVKIHEAPTPQLQLVKEVKVKGTDGWNKEVSTKPGTEIQWRLGTKDISNANLNNVVVRDVMPPHMKLVPGSVRIINANGDKVQPDNPLFAGGFNVGNYVPGSTQYIIFNTTALDDFSTCEVRVRNIAHARSDQTPTELTDTSDVVIKKDNCTPPPPSPSYSCDLLQATILSDRTVKYTAQASAKDGAQIVMYTYDFGDGNTLNTDKTTVEHTYADAGNYVARVKVLVNVNGTNKIAESEACAAAVTFTTPDTPGTVTPGGSSSSTPDTLVNSGPGEVAGVFAATVALGMIGYRWFLGRRVTS